MRCTMLRLVLLTCLLVDQSFSTATPAQQLAVANGDFALQLYDKLRTSVPGSNIFFSPISVSSAFALLYAGAAGETRAQMETTLNLDTLPKDATHSVHKVFHQLLESFNDPTNNYTLDIATRLFGREDYQLSARHGDLLDVAKYYDAQLETLPFATDAEGSRLHINEWVANHTAQKILNLLPQGSVNSMTALVLANAVYFKGLWDMPFKVASTRKGYFQVSSDTTQQIELDMMHISDKLFPHAESSTMDCKILELPYSGGEVSMYILLPNRVDGLAHLENSLTIETLNQALTSDLQTVKVHVTVPKFKLTQDISLKPLLSAMGMEDVFVAGKADLSGINGAKDLYVSSAFHKAYVDVNEEGTEAAGATGIVISVTSVHITTTFVADHPFLFLIREKPTGSILFLGRLTGAPDNTQQVYSLNGAESEGGSSAASRRVQSATVCVFVVLFTLFLIWF